MAFGIAAVMALESWDARHEASTALADLMHDHELLALALAAKLDPQTRPSPAAANPVRAVDALCSAAAALERAGGVVVVLKLASASGLRSCHGKTPSVPALEQMLTGTGDSMALTRAEAVVLGLPERSAVAGIARLPASTGVTAVIVTGSAASERDRSQRQQARTIISMAVVSALILGFGLADLRRQRRELALERRVELEKARQERDVELAKANRMATVAALASGFAHEIGTPLGIISGRIELLRADSVTAERRGEVLGQVSQQVERLGLLVRSFLAFARGEAGLFVRVLANDIAKNAVRLVRHRFAAADVELTLELDGGEGAAVACEPPLFEQVLVNLLVNALEASASGQRVTLRVAPAGDRTEFSVTDEGSGIPASVMERVTEPFFTTKAPSGGTGLGLTIAREIVVHHRGELAIDRRQHADGSTAGTRVVVRVPRLGAA